MLITNGNIAESQEDRRMQELYQMVGNQKLLLQQQPIMMPFVATTTHFSHSILEQLPLQLQQQQSSVFPQFNQ